MTDHGDLLTLGAPALPPRLGRGDGPVALAVWARGDLAAVLWVDRSGEYDFAVDVATYTREPDGTWRRRGSGGSEGQAPLCLDESDGSWHHPTGRGITWGGGSWIALGRDSLRVHSGFAAPGVAAVRVMSSTSGVSVVRPEPATGAFLVGVAFGETATVAALDDAGVELADEAGTIRHRLAEDDIPMPRMYVDP